MTERIPQITPAPAHPDNAGADELRNPAETTRASWWVRAALLLPVMVLLSLFGAAAIRHQQTLSIGAALARGEAPSVPALTLPALDGSSISLATTLRGHPVILNFWASWCIPCRDEAPLLESVWKEFGPRGLLVIGINTQDLEQPARGFVKEFHITYPTLRDPDGSVARLFSTTGVPETFFVDADGRIRGKFPGVEVRPEAWRQAALDLLSGRARVP